MGVIGDIFELVSIGACDNQQVLNAWYYRQTTVNGGTDTSARYLRAAWQQDVQTALLNLVPDVFTLGGIRVRNLFDPDEFEDFQLTPALPGNSGTGFNGTFQAMNFRTNRGSGTIRRGYKRIGPYDVDNYVDEVPIAAHATRIAEAESAFSAAVQWSTEPSSPFYSPVVVGRILDGVTAAGNPRYRLPASQAEAKYFIPAGYTYQGLTTQSSRKVGRGA